MKDIISKDVKLDLKIFSEMEPCKSCSDIIDDVNELLPNSTEASGGTLFNKNHLIPSERDY